MATNITDSKEAITTDDDFFWSVVAIRPAVVSIDFTAGTGGSFTIKDSQGNPYRNSDDTADLTIDFNDTLTKYTLDPTGGHIKFTSTGMVAGSASANIRVISQDTAK